MYKPIHFVGKYHYGVSVYPPKYPQDVTWSSVDGKANTVTGREPSYSLGQNSALTCALPGPVCLAAWCDRQTGTWRCPDFQAPDPYQKLMSTVCSKVDGPQGTWGWQCSNKYP